MRTSSAGKIIRTTAPVGHGWQPTNPTSRDHQERLFPQRGVTLIELLVVVTLIALLAGISFPSVASGLDSLRLRSASNAIVAFLDTALDRSDRRQQAVELRISPGENVLTARSADDVFDRRLELPDGMRILSVTPRVEGSTEDARRFLVYPGGAIPKVSIEIQNKSGRRRMVSIDPITGVARSDMEGQ
jgi:prepilin-type N-terminal cleavage/methylation domain-containing protein